MSKRSDRLSTWETTVYGSTLEEIQFEAEEQAKKFGVSPDGLTYVIIPHTMSRTMGGQQFVIDYEAQVSTEIG